MHVDQHPRAHVTYGYGSGSWIHVPPATAQGSSSQSLAPATPIKVGTSGAAGGSNSSALMHGHAGGCQAVTDQRQRLSNCAVEVLLIRSSKPFNDTDEA